MDYVFSVINVYDDYCSERKKLDNTFRPCVENGIDDILRGQLLAAGFSEKITPDVLAQINYSMVFYEPARKLLTRMKPKYVDVEAIVITCNEIHEPAPMIQDYDSKEWMVDPEYDQCGLIHAEELESRKDEARARNAKARWCSTYIGYGKDDRLKNDIKQVNLAYEAMADAMERLMEYVLPEEVEVEEVVTQIFEFDEKFGTIESLTDKAEEFLIGECDEDELLNDCIRVSSSLQETRKMRNDCLLIGGSRRRRQKKFVIRNRGRNRRGGRGKRRDLMRDKKPRVFRENDILMFVGKGSGIPRSEISELKYVDNLTVRTHAANTTQNWQYQTGLTAALIDPAGPGSGTVSGIPLVGSYTRFRPLRVGIDVRISNPEVSAVTVVVMPSYVVLGGNNTIAQATMQSYMNDRNAFVWQLDGFPSSRSSKRIRKFWPVERILGLNSDEWRSDPNYTGGVGGHPTSSFYVNVMAFTNEAIVWVTGLTILAQYKMLYELYQPLDN